MTDRREHRAELLEIVTPIFRQRTSDDWIARLSATVPVGKVNSFAEAMDAYATEYPDQVLSWQHETLGRVRTVGSPIHVGDSTPQARRAPRLGEHTDEVLRELSQSPQAGEPMTKENA